jgi:ectoine hydroxylase-related dioxygenase (phytanoyl-CoA dioxygenase family)
LLPGTHKKTTLNFEKSRFKEKDIDKDNEVKFLGNEKGRAIIFDTNVTHRLNRSLKSNTRDTITINFTPGQYLKKIYYGLHDKISNERLRNFLTSNSLLEKRF